MSLLTEGAPVESGNIDSGRPQPKPSRPVARRAVFKSGLFELVPMSHIVDAGACSILNSTSTTSYCPGANAYNFVFPFPGLMCE